MDNLSNPLNLLATNMCSPMIIYIVFVVVTGIALFMTRSSLKRYNTEKMDTLFNFHLMKSILTQTVILLPAIIKCYRCENDKTKQADLALAPFIGDIEAAENIVRDT